MLMTNENVQLFFHDRFMEKTVLRLIPRWIHPNHVTVLRVLLTPIVLYFVWSERWSIVLPLFLFTAFTDAIDGSLARTRKQITMWGTAADPAADKLLIASVMVLFVAREVNPAFAIIIVCVEILIAGAALYRRAHGKVASANEYGKIKMVLQVLGVSFLLLARFMHFEMAVPFAIGTLGVAIIFALVSLLTYGI